METTHWIWMISSGMGIKHAYRIRNTETRDKMQTDKYTQNERIKSTELILQIYYHNMMLPPLSGYLSHILQFYLQFGYYFWIPTNFSSIEFLWYLVDFNKTSFQIPFASKPIK